MNSNFNYSKIAKSCFSRGVDEVISVDKYGNWSLYHVYPDELVYLHTFPDFSSMCHYVSSCFHSVIEFIK